MAVGASERAFAHPFVAPNQVPGFELLANPAFAIRVPVEVLTHSHHAAMMIDHVLVGVGLPGLERAAAAGAQTLTVTGDRDADAEALAGALDGDAPGLVLDFVWGPVAETAFRALGRRGLGEDSAEIRYVQIGALAGAGASVPAALLRSRKLTISGSGAGSVSARDIKTKIPAYLQVIADGSVEVPFRTFALSDVSAAWTASAATGPRVVLVRD